MNASKVSRNEFCPCGSGKKYKKCCMIAQEASDFSWHKLRATEGTIVDNHLLPYLSNKLDSETISCITEEFFSAELPEEVDKGALFSSYFMPWLLFNWVADADLGLENFDTSQSIAINYLIENKHKLSSFECAFILAINETYYSYYIILEVALGKSLTVKDILLGTEHIIKEHQGSYQLKKGDIIFTRILTLDKQAIFIGMVPYVIPGDYYNDLVGFRKWLVEENNNHKLSGKVLRHNLDFYLRDYFFEVITALFFEPAPILHNTDNELVQFSKSYFKLTLEVEETAKLLLPLTLAKSLADVLDEAEYNKEGMLQNITISWLKKGNSKNKSWENTVLGHITISKSKLILETNSLERTVKAKKLLSKYLGANIIFQKTLIETPSQKLANGQKKSSPKVANSELITLPEVQSKLKEMAKKHWASWFDEPIPALNNLTPRAAAKTKAGKELLEALLLQYDNKDAEQSIEMNIFQPDLNYIRAELKLN